MYLCPRASTCVALRGTKRRLTRLLICPLAKRSFNISLVSLQSERLTLGPSYPSPTFVPRPVRRYNCVLASQMTRPSIGNAVRVANFHHCTVNPCSLFATDGTTSNSIKPAPRRKRQTGTTSAHFQSSHGPADVTNARIESMTLPITLSRSKRAHGYSWNSATG
jgi:hypothetical protein